jgi:oligosaccharide repeat unit polymerase
MPELFCIGGIGVAWWLSSLRFKDVFTPLFVYVGIWCTAILLFRLRLIAYNELTEPTALLIAGSIVAYAVGCLVCPKPVKAQGDPVASTSPSVSRSALERLLKKLIVIYALAFLIFVLKMHSQFGLGTYFSDPSQIRAEANDWMKLGVLGLPLFLHYPILILCFYDVLQFRRWRWFHGVGFGLPLLQELLWTGRSNMVLFAITLAFFWIYLRGWRKLNSKLILIGAGSGAVLLSLFLVLGNAYGKLIEESDVYRTTDFISDSPDLLTVAYPYMYLTSSLPCFQEAMADVHYFSNGARTLYPVAHALASIGVLPKTPEWTSFDYYFVPIPVNLYTHLFTFYQDFGRPGVIVMPFLLGLLHTYFYWRMRAFPSLWSIAAASISIGTTCFSVAVCLTSTLLVWECYIVLYLSWRTISSSRKCYGGFLTTAFSNHESPTK